MEDAVSRQSINKLQKYRYNCGYATIICVSLNSINELPPVKPDERMWVPVSEGTPKEGETVTASTKYAVYPEARYTKEKGWEWAYESVTDHWVKLKDVEAWMPLPKRYIRKDKS